jgi:toxin ParE1/3/4
VKRSIIKREEAKRDLDLYAAYIGEASPEAAIRFLDAAEASFRGLAEIRYKGIRYESLDPALEGMRRFSIRGFEKFLIFYFPRENGIEVIRVIHGSRDILKIIEHNIFDD